MRARLRLPARLLAQTVRLTAAAARAPPSPAPPNAPAGHPPPAVTRRGARRGAGRGLWPRRRPRPSGRSSAVARELSSGCAIQCGRGLHVLKPRPPNVARAWPRAVARVPPCRRGRATGPAACRCANSARHARARAPRPSCSATCLRTS